MKRFFTAILATLLLAGCTGATAPERTAYRWEIYDVNFTYPSDFNIIEDRRLTFSGHPFDTLIMTAGDLTSDVNAGFEIEAMSQQNTPVEDMLSFFGETLDYEDKGIYKMGGHEFRKICYEASDYPHCSYLINKNRNYYQFNLKDEYRDDFLRSLEFVK
jgi:hypothetical protein